MAYAHIMNLYKHREILGEKEVYALEKIHGTSAHIRYSGGELSFFSGGVTHSEFVKLFNAEELKESFAYLADNPHLGGRYDVVVYGEAYGGKCQRMSDVYGEALRFVAFDVKVSRDGVDQWKRVESARSIVRALGLEFVDYVRIPMTLSAVDAERDKESVQAIRNGMGNGKQREGIVLRPIEEKIDSHGNRLIAKHKQANFRETASPRPIDLDKLAVMAVAQEIADEWVTENRLEHVIQHLQLLGGVLDMTHTGAIIKEMAADVKREGEGEIVWSPEVEKCVGRATALLYKRLVQKNWSGE